MRLTFMNRKAWTRRAIAVAACALTGALPARGWSQELVETLSQAMRHDRGYATALAERDLGLADAKRAGLVYLPSLTADTGRAAFEAANRTTLQVTQPVLDLERYASFREMEGRAEYALATFRVKELELSRKVYKTVATLIQLRELEVLALEEAQALDRQAQRATRRFELGSGSLIDVTQAQVQHAQALARYQSLQSDLTSAQQKYQSLTGIAGMKVVSRPDYQAASVFQMPAGLADMAFADSPLVLQAQGQLKLTELSRTRARTAYLPQVNAIVRNTQYNGMRDVYTGLQLSFPAGLSAYAWTNQHRAELDVERATAALEEVREQVRVEGVTSGFSLQAFSREMAFRNKAVEISQLTIAQTEKAYEAGVAKAAEVVNAILASFDVQRQRLALHMNVAEQVLSYQVVRGVEPAQAMKLSQTLFK